MHIFSAITILLIMLNTDAFHAAWRVVITHIRFVERTEPSKITECVAARTYLKFLALLFTTLDEVSDLHPQ